MCSGPCTANHILLVYQYEYVQGTLCLSKPTYRCSHEARMNVSSVEQYQTTYCRRADRLHARKKSIAWPRHSDLTDYYLQSVVRFRCLLHSEDGVYLSGGSLPSARHTILYWLPLHIITRVSSVGNANTRLPAAVKPTSMHVLVCTYKYGGLIYGRPLYYSCTVQYDDDMHTVRTT